MASTSASGDRDGSPSAALRDLARRGAVAKTTRREALCEHLDSWAEKAGASPGDVQPPETARSVTRSDGAAFDTRDSSAVADGGPVRIAAYAGFDATAPSLHAGHLLPLLVLRRLRRAGLPVAVVVGDGTALVGDPRANGERDPLDPDQVTEWSLKLEQQALRIVSLDSFGGDPAAPSPPRPPALALRNREWLESAGLLEFLRGTAKRVPVSDLLSRDVARRRLRPGGPGMSLGEFSYSTVQAMDWLRLYERHGCSVQVGGGDQWGNLCAGMDLVGRTSPGGADLHAVATALLETGGEKVGKSTGAAGGGLWLDPELTTPFAWHQWFVRVPDADAVRLLGWLSDTPLSVLREFAQWTERSPERREAQRQLAHEATVLVHGFETARRVERAAAALFDGGDLLALPRADLEGAARAASPVSVSAPLPGDGDAPSLARVAVAAGLCDSLSAARRLADGGGLYSNGRRAEPGDADEPVPGSDWLFGEWLVLRRGKQTAAVVRRVPGPAESLSLLRAVATGGDDPGGLALARALASAPVVRAAPEPVVTLREDAPLSGDASPGESTLGSGAGSGAGSDSGDRPVTGTADEADGDSSNPPVAEFRSSASGAVDGDAL